MTPKKALKEYLPAFRNLFESDEPDLERFIRLAIDVLDPDKKIIGYRGCSAIYEPTKIILTSDGTSTIGHCKVQTDSGLTYTD